VARRYIGVMYRFDATTSMEDAVLIVNPEGGAVGHNLARQPWPTGR
jgi:hypothetical protein